MTETTTKEQVLEVARDAEMAAYVLWQLIQNHCTDETTLRQAILTRNLTQDAATAASQLS